MQHFFSETFSQPQEVSIQLLLLAPWLLPLFSPFVPFGVYVFEQEFLQSRLSKESQRKQRPLESLLEQVLRLFFAFFASRADKPVVLTEGSEED